MKLIRSLKMSGKEKAHYSRSPRNVEGEGGLGKTTAEGERGKEADKSKADPFTEIKQGFHEGMDVLSNQMILPIMDDLQQFTKDTQTAALKGPGVMIKSLEEMRDQSGEWIKSCPKFLRKDIRKRNCRC